MDRRNKHFRDLPSTRFGYSDDRMPSEFRKFVERKVLPRLKLTGYKQAAQRAIAVEIVHCLVSTHLVGKCVADSRRKAEPGARLRAKVWDAVIAAGFAKCCLGSEASGKVTRYRASKRLLQLRKQWQLKSLVDLNLERNTEMPKPTRYALVYLHSGKLNLTNGKLLPTEAQKQPISIPEYVRRQAQPGPDGKPHPRAVENGLNYFRAIEDEIERINLSNSEHAWQAFQTDPETGRRFVRPVNYCLRQVHAGKMFRAVRLYSWGEFSGQALSKEMRKTMLIDGERTAELDFSGMAPRMLYHFCGHNPRGDVYRPAKVLPEFYGLANANKSKKAVARGFIKRVTNICLNVSSRARAVGAVQKLLRDKSQADFLHSLLKLERVSVDGLLGRIQQVHPKVADRFFTDVGTDLMTTDGRIMLRILGAFATANRPALGIHDAVVCRESDVAFAEAAMCEAYRQFFRFDPVIKRAY